MYCQFAPLFELRYIFPWQFGLGCEDDLVAIKIVFVLLLKIKSL